MTNTEEKRLAKTALSLVFIVAAAKVLGLIRDTLIAGAYGTSPAAVAFDTAAAIPTLLFDFLVGSAITAAFIPVFNRILAERGRGEAMRFASSYINLALVVSLAVSLAGYAAAEYLVRLSAPSLGGEASALAVSLFRLMLPVIPTASLAFLFVGILQSLGSFRLPAAISIVSAAAVIGYLLLCNGRFGIRGLAVATLVGWLGQAAVQIPMLHRLGYRHSFRIDLRRGELAEALRTALPMLAAAWTLPLAALLDTRFASAVEGGRAITAFGYARKIELLLGGILAFVATNLLFPRLARAVAVGDGDTSLGLLRVSGKLLLFFAAPVAAAAAVLAEPIVRILFEHGDFTASDTALTAAALSLVALGVVCTALSELLTKALIAARHPVSPMVAALTALLCHFALGTLLTPALGIRGIALAFTLAAAVQLAVLLAAAIRRGVVAVTAPDVWDAIRSLLAAAAAGGAVYVLRALVTASLPSWRDLVICLTAGAVLYLALTAAMRSGVYPLLRRLFGKEDGQA